MLVIKEINLADLELLLSLSRRTFVDTFGSNYAEDDLNNYLHERLSGEVLEKELSDPKNNFFFILDSLGKPFGYIKITPSSVKFLKDLDASFKQPKSSCYLERFYLLNEAQGTGLAHLAMSELINWIRENTEDEFIHLTVFIENHRAQKFYRRYGFFHAGDTIYEVGNARDHELLYLCEIRQ